MQKIFCAVCSCQRPVIFFTPLICTHNEKFDWLSAEFVLYAFEKKVVPTKSDLVFVEICVGTEVHISDLASATCVTSDDHQQMLSFTGFFAIVRFNAHVVAQRTTQENVVPGRDVQDGNIDIGEVFFKRPSLPIFVVGWMGKPVEKVRSRIWSRG